MLFIEKIKKAKEVIREIVNKHDLDDMVVGCSFGKDSMVLLHLIKQIEPNMKVFSIMANTEFRETINFTEKISNDWGLNLTKVSFTQEEDSEKDLSKCCGVPKVAATVEAVKNVKVWFAGIRNTEGITRANFKHVEDKDGLIKVNPILEFTEFDIWRYCAVFGVPLNMKYREGYRSLGCKHCSTPELKEKETERQGRWRGTKKEGLECGIHTMPLR